MLTDGGYSSGHTCGTKINVKSECTVPVVVIEAAEETPVESNVV